MLSLIPVICVITLFLLSSVSLLGRLISLEIFSFFVLFLATTTGMFALSGSFLLLVYFVVFVLEGVVGIMALISLVSYVGSDYMSIISIRIW